MDAKGHRSTIDLFDLAAGSNAADALTVANGRTFALTAQSNGGNDTLQAGSGNDELNGGSGADRMIGGGGSNTYYVDDAGDRVVELASDAGTDTVLAVCSFSKAKRSRT